LDGPAGRGRVGVRQHACSAAHASHAGGADENTNAVRSSGRCACINVSSSVKAPLAVNVRARPLGLSACTSTCMQHAAHAYSAYSALYFVWWPITGCLRGDDRDGASSVALDRGRGAAAATHAWQGCGCWVALCGVGRVCVRVSVFERRYGGTYVPWGYSLADRPRTVAREARRDSAQKV
jgi:hypothetical protein